MAAMVDDRDHSADGTAAPARSTDRSVAVATIQSATVTLFRCPVGLPIGGSPHRGAQAAMELTGAALLHRRVARDLDAVVAGLTFNTALERSRALSTASSNQGTHVRTRNTAAHGDNPDLNTRD